MTESIRMAVAHFPPIIGEVERNIAAIDHLSNQAAERSARFILFSETCLTGYPMKAGSAAAVSISSDGPELTRLAQIARRRQITVCAGYLERRHAACHSSQVIIEPDGQRLVIRKRSVDASDGQIGLTAATEANPDFSIGGIRAALAVCMDGTEDFFASAAQRRIQIILHPSAGACTAWRHASDPDAPAVDATETSHCRNCAERARLIAKRLNVAYLVANPIGFDGLRAYPGNSWIIAPGGDVLVHLPPTAIIENMREAVGVASLTFPDHNPHH